MKIKEFLNLLKSNLDNIIILDGKGFEVFDKKENLLYNDEYKDLIENEIDCFDIETRTAGDYIIDYYYAEYFEYDPEIYLIIKLS